MSEVKAKVENRQLVGEPMPQNLQESVIPVPTRRGITGNRGVS